MDESAKTLGRLILLFMSVFLILGIISFYLAASNAREAAYSIVEYIEIREGYEDKPEVQQIVQDYADSSHISVTVTKVDDSGIHASGEKNRYEVKVTFNHVFTVLNFGRDTTYTLYTRAVEY